MTLQDSPAMDSTTHLTEPPFEAASASWAFWSVIITSAVAFALLVSQLCTTSGPKALRDPIPRVYDTLQFMSNNYKFMVRIQNALQDASLLRFYLGPKTVYLVTGPQGMRGIFGREMMHTVTNQEQMTRYALLTLYNMMRDVKKPITLDGHTIPKGSLLQAPMQVAHYNEAIWGASGHPASDFWAERHVRTGDGGKRVYSMAGIPTSYFPFGGGANMCPGRYLAKSEILMTVALVVSRFDVEVVGWTTWDGSPSHRAAEGDIRFCGAGAIPPDREMKIRWSRRP